MARKDVVPPGYRLFGSLGDAMKGLTPDEAGFLALCMQLNPDPDDTRPAWLDLQAVARESERRLETIIAYVDKLSKMAVRVDSTYVPLLSPVAWTIDDFLRIQDLAFIAPTLRVKESDDAPGPEQDRASAGI